MTKNLNKNKSIDAPIDSVYLNQIEKDLNSKDKLKSKYPNVRLSNKQISNIAGLLFNINEPIASYQFDKQCNISNITTKKIMEEFHLFVRSPKSIKEFKDKREVDSYYWPIVSLFHEYTIDLIISKANYLPLPNKVRYNIILRYLQVYMYNKFNIKEITNVRLSNFMKKHNLNISLSTISKFMRELKFCKTNSERKVFADKCLLRQQGSEERGSVQTIEEIHCYLFPEINNNTDLRNYLEIYADIDADLQKEFEQMFK